MPCRPAVQVTAATAVCRGASTTANRIRSQERDSSAYHGTAGSLSVASTSDCHMTAEAALQVSSGSAEEASNSDPHTLRCPDEQVGNSLVAGNGASADLGLLEETLTNRSVVTEGTSVIAVSEALNKLHRTPHKMCLPTAP
ncbi:uncharacterized protein LOC142584808 [Dermacentor variabilis]|uniref:uncharacterized protein LOC142584808 n=1 Tax=Dermacentor variabilis TaxID=34621 RepID=UPI003F5CAA8D